MIRDATAIARQVLYWRLKKHPNLNPANFISLWPSRGSRWPRKYEAIERLFQETDYKLGRKDHAA
jgi:hypothetical protein